MNDTESPKPTINKDLTTEFDSLLLLQLLPEGVRLVVMGNFVLSKPISMSLRGLGNTQPLKTEKHWSVAQAASFTAVWKSLQIPLKKREFIAISGGLPELPNCLQIIDASCYTF